MSTKVKTREELIAELTPEERALVFPNLERKNFVVRKSWLGQGRMITFVIVLVVNL